MHDSQICSVGSELVYNNLLYLPCARGVMRRVSVEHLETTYVETDANTDTGYRDHISPDLTSLH